MTEAIQKIDRVQKLAIMAQAVFKGLCAASAAFVIVIVIGGSDSTLYLSLGLGISALSFLGEAYLRSRYGGPERTSRLAVGVGLSAAFGAALGLLAPHSAEAKDLGSIGPVFELTEPNLLVGLYKRFDELEREGAVEKLREDMTRKTKSYVFEPRPVEGVGRAERTTVRYFDPSITVKENLADQNGRVFAWKGTVVNPLDHVLKPPPVMAMIDGGDPAQVEWAKSVGDEINSRIILVRGRPIDLTKEHQRRFYFDQDGLITKRFGVLVTPTLIEPDGRRFKITEVAVQ